MSSYIVLGTPTCGYCTQAKSLLENNNLEYVYKDLTELDKEEYNVYMDAAKVPFRTVPQIFQVEGDELNYIGGFTELKESL